MLRNDTMHYPMLAMVLHYTYIRQMAWENIKSVLQLCVHLHYRTILNLHHYHFSNDKGGIMVRNIALI